MLLSCLGELNRERGGAAFPGDPLEVAQLALAQGLFSAGIPSPDALRQEMTDAMDRRKAELEGTDSPPPRERKVRWYRIQRQAPVRPTGTVTVVQYCYSVLWWKMYSKSVNKGVDFLCSWLSTGGLLPPDNIAPRSEHICRGVLGILRPDEYAVDLCRRAQCPHVFGKPHPPQLRQSRPGERCFRCGTHRHVKRNNQVEPARR